MRYINKVLTDWPNQNLLLLRDCTASLRNKLILGSVHKEEKEYMDENSGKFEPEYEEGDMWYNWVRDNSFRIN